MKITIAGILNNKYPVALKGDENTMEKNPSRRRNPSHTPAANLEPSQLTQIEEETTTRNQKRNTNCPESTDRIPNPKSETKTHKSLAWCRSTNKNKSTKRIHRRRKKAEEGRNQKNESGNGGKTIRRWWKYRKRRKEKRNLWRRGVWYNRRGEGLKEVDRCLPNVYGGACDPRGPLAIKICWLPVWKGLEQQTRKKGTEQELIENEPTAFGCGTKRRGHGENRIRKRQTGTRSIVAFSSSPLAMDPTKKQTQVELKTENKQIQPHMTRYFSFSTQDLMKLNSQIHVDFELEMGVIISSFCLERTNIYPRNDNSKILIVSSCVGSWDPLNFLLDKLKLSCTTAEIRIYELSHDLTPKESYKSEKKNIQWNFCLGNLIWYDKSRYGCGKKGRIFINDNACNEIILFIYERKSSSSMLFTHGALMYEELNQVTQIEQKRNTKSKTDQLRRKTKGNNEEKMKRCYRNIEQVTANKIGWNCRKKQGTWMWRRAKHMKSKGKIKLHSKRNTNEVDRTRKRCKEEMHNIKRNKKSRSDPKFIEKERIEHVYINGHALF